MSARLKAEAVRLHDGGMTAAAIGRLLGVPRSTVSTWFDPDHLVKQQARRKRYQGKCVSCGAPTDGSNGRAAAPRYCAACRPAVDTVWTQGAIVAAIHRFAARYGRPPAATDFFPNMARRLGHEQRAERFYADGDYPTAVSVRARFGTWNAAMQAAGYEPHKAGQYDRSRVLA